MSEEKNPAEVAGAPDQTEAKEDLSDVADDDAVIGGLEDDVEEQGGGSQ